MNFFLGFSFCRQIVFGGKYDARNEAASFVPKQEQIVSVLTHSISTLNVQRLVPSIKAF
jgi:hypothetical protein